MSSKESQIGTSINEEDSLSQYAIQLATASVLPMVFDKDRIDKRIKRRKEMGRQT